MNVTDPGVGAAGEGRPLPPRQVVLGTLVVLAVAAAFALLQVAGEVLPYFLLGLVVAVSAEPAVAWLVARRIPRHAAGLLVLALLLAVCGGAVLLLFPMVAEHGGAMAERAPGLCTSLRASLQAWAAQGGRSHVLSSAVHQVLPSDCGLAALGGAKWGYLENLGDPVWAAVAALVGAYAWITERLAIQRGVLKLVPVDKRDAGRALIDEIDGRLGAFVRGQAVLCLIVGTITTGFYLLLGVHGAVALGALAAFLEVIPVAGPLVAAGVGVLATAGTQPSLILGVVAFAAILRVASDYWLTPLVMGRSVGVNPLLLLLTLVALGSVGGIIGAMVAVPIAALLQMGLHRLLAAEPQAETPDGRDAVSLLRYRAMALALAARRMGRQRAALGRNCSAEDGAELLSLRLAHLLGDGEAAAPPARSPEAMS